MQTRKSQIMLAAAVAGTSLVGWSSLAQAGWTGATSGSTFATNAVVNNTSNWSAGTIDGDFTNAGWAAQTNNTTIFLLGNATMPKFDFKAVASPPALTIQSNTASANGTIGPVTVTLNGDLLWGATIGKGLTFGTSAGTSSTSAVNLQLSAGEHDFLVGRQVSAQIIMHSGLSGTGASITKYGSSGLILNSPSTFTGVLNIRANGVTLNGSLSTLTTESIRVLAYDGAVSNFSMNNPPNTPGNRVSDAATVKLFSSGGGGAGLAGVSFTYTGTNNSSETIGTVEMLSGQSRLAAGANVATPGYVLAMTISTLNRYNHSVSQAAGLNASTNGRLGTEGKIFIGNAASHLVGGAGTGTAVPIIPFMYGQSTGAYSSTALDDMVGYDATSGLYLLDQTANFWVGNVTDGGAAGQNVRINATGSTTAGSATIKSLLLNPATSGATVNLNGGTLSITSGTIVTNGNADLTNGTVDFGTVEGFIFGTNTRTFGVNLTNSTSNALGVTVGSPNVTSPLHFTGTNTFSGPLTIASGEMRFAGGNAVPDSAKVYIHPGASAALGSAAGLAAVHDVEVIGELHGGAPYLSKANYTSTNAVGNVRVGVATTTSVSSDALIIGTTSGLGDLTSTSNAHLGHIILNGGVLAPGLDDTNDTKIGTINIVRDLQGAPAAIATELIDGTIAVDITNSSGSTAIGSGTSDLLKSDFSTITITNDPGAVALTVNILAGTTISEGDVWTIMTATGISTTGGQTTGFFTGGITVTGAPGVTFTESIQDGNKVVLTAAVPEPSGVGLLAVGSLGLLGRWRRKRSR